MSKYGAKYVANGLKKLNMSDSFIKKVTGIDLNAKKTPVSTYAGYQNPVSSSNKGVGKAVNTSKIINTASVGKKVEKLLLVMLCENIPAEILVSGEK